MDDESTLVALQTRIPASLREQIDHYGAAEHRDRSNMSLVLLLEAVAARQAPPKPTVHYRSRKAANPPVVEPDELP